MSAQENAQAQEPRRGPMGHGPGGRMMPGEKPKNLKGTLAKLIAFMGRFKAAIVVVLVVLGGGIYYVYDSFGSGDSSGSSSASEVVKGYLEALSNGNADMALSFSNDQPASKEFLSSDVLKKQRSISPFT